MEFSPFVITWMFINNILYSRYSQTIHLLSFEMEKLFKKMNIWKLKGKNIILKSSKFQFSKNNYYLISK